MDWREHFMHVFDRDRWTWAELERRTGTDASQIQRWATTPTEPALNTAIQIAAAMEIGLDELFLGSLPPSRIEALVRKQLVLMHEEMQSGLAEKAAGNLSRA